MHAPTQSGTNRSAGAAAMAEATAAGHSPPTTVHLDFPATSTEPSFSAMNVDHVYQSRRQEPGFYSTRQGDQKGQLPRPAGDFRHLKRTVLALCRAAPGWHDWLVDGSLPVEPQAARRGVSDVVNTTFNRFSQGECLTGSDIRHQGFTSTGTSVDNLLPCQRSTRTLYNRGRRQFLPALPGADAPSRGRGLLAATG